MSIINALMGLGTLFFALQVLYATCFPLALALNSSIIVGTIVYLFMSKKS